MLRNNKSAIQITSEDENCILPQTEDATTCIESLKTASEDGSVTSFFSKCKEENSHNLEERLSSKKLDSSHEDEDYLTCASGNSSQFNFFTQTSRNEIVSRTRAVLSKLLLAAAHNDNGIPRELLNPIGGKEEVLCYQSATYATYHKHHDGESVAEELRCFNVKRTSETQSVSYRTKATSKQTTIHQNATDSESTMGSHENVDSSVCSLSSTSDEEGSRTSDEEGSRTQTTRKYFPGVTIVKIRNRSEIQLDSQSNPKDEKILTRNDLMRYLESITSRQNQKNQKSIDPVTTNQSTNRTSLNMRKSSCYSENAEFSIDSTQEQQSSFNPSQQSNDIFKREAHHLKLTAQEDQSSKNVETESIHADNFQEENTSEQHKEDDGAAPTAVEQWRRQQAYEQRVQRITEMYAKLYAAHTTHVTFTSPRDKIWANYPCSCRYKMKPQPENGEQYAPFIRRPPRLHTSVLEKAIRLKGGAQNFYEKWLEKKRSEEAEKLRHKQLLEEKQRKLTEERKRISEAKVSLWHRRKALEESTTNQCENFLTHQLFAPKVLPIVKAKLLATKAMQTLTANNKSQMHFEAWLKKKKEDAAKAREKRRLELEKSKLDHDMHRINSKKADNKSKANRETKLNRMKCYDQARSNQWRLPF